MVTASHLRSGLAAALTCCLSVSVVNADDRSRFNDPTMGFGYSVSAPLELLPPHRDDGGVLLLVQNPYSGPLAAFPDGTLCRVLFARAATPVSLDAVVDHMRSRMGVAVDSVKANPFPLGGHETREFVVQATPRTGPGGDVEVDIVFVGGRSGVATLTCSTWAEDYPRLQQMLPDLLAGLEFD